MDFFSWIDNRTLLACQCILVLVFSIMMLGLRSLHPQLRGITPIAVGFLLGVPATLLLTVAGKIPLAVSGVGGGACVLLSSLFLYRGILDFCAGKRRSAMGWEGDDGQRHAAKGHFAVLVVISAVAFAALVDSAWVHHNIAPSVVAISGVLAVARGLMAWSLIRSSRGRMAMRLLGGSMAIFALLAATHTVSATLHPPSDLLERGTTETLTLLGSVIFICFEGVFYLLMFAGDVTESVHEQACLDHLSGTLNRRGIEAALASEMARRRRTGANFAVLLIDLDEFKAVNDRYGHPAGDAALRAVARSAGSTIRLYDRLGRFGGDEFLVLLPQTTAEEASAIAERIGDAVRGWADESRAGERIQITVSIGATCSTSHEEQGAILARADAALYEAKRAGRNCVRVKLFQASADGRTLPPSGEMMPTTPHA